MSKRKLTIVFMLLSIMGCNSVDEKVETIEVQKSVTPTPVAEKQEADMLNRLGFEFKEEKIIIDINKTSHFFEMLETQMENKAKEIEEKIIKAEINVTEGMGIHIEGDEIGIDLNKTKNMLQQINILMKDIFLDINHTKH